MRRTILVGWALATALPACGRGHGSTAESSDAAPAPSVDAAAPSSAVAEGPEAGRGGPAVWAGTYKSAVSTLYVPPDWKVRWRPVETPDGIGEGTLTLSVDATGRVHGTIEGPLGPAVVDGYFSEGNLSATIARRDPHDHGFAGVLSGKAMADRLEGTMNLSLATGGALRTATFAVAPSDKATR